MWRYDKKVPLFDVPEKDVRSQVLVALDWIRDRRNARETSVPDKPGADRLHESLRFINAVVAVRPLRRVFSQSCR
jgi:hypothetical protein